MRRFLAAVLLFLILGAAPAQGLMGPTEKQRLKCLREAMEAGIPPRTPAALAFCIPGPRDLPMPGAHL